MIEGMADDLYGIGDWLLIGRSFPAPDDGFAPFREKALKLIIKRYPGCRPLPCPFESILPDAIQEQRHRCAGPKEFSAPARRLDRLRSSLHKPQSQNLGKTPSG